MAETKNMIGSETDSARRVRKHRERKQLEEKALPCNANEIKSNTDIDIEKEIDIELDLEKEYKEKF